MCLVMQGHYEKASNLHTLSHGLPVALNELQTTMIKKQTMKTTKHDNDHVIKKSPGLTALLEKAELADGDDFFFFFLRVLLRR